MPFEKGKSKTGGRKAGTPNKTTLGIKHRVHELIDKHFERIEDLLEKLEPKDQMTAYLKFLEYVLPKQREQKIDLSTLSDQEIDELLDRVLKKMD